MLPRFMYCLLIIFFIFIFVCFFFFFNDTATTEIYTLSLHDALPISAQSVEKGRDGKHLTLDELTALRSEEHTSELQSRGHLVCRLLLEKKQKTIRSRNPAKKKKKKTQINNTKAKK